MTPNAELYIIGSNHLTLAEFEAMVQQLPSLSLDDLLYPESDGKPVADNTIQFRLIVAIQGGLDALFQAREDVFVAADLFWYPVKLSPQQILQREIPPRQAPDVMVAFGRPQGERRSYKQWEEGNIAPQVVFEILSQSNSKGEMHKKFEFYQRYGVEEYYLYDPKRNDLQGWERRGTKLESIAPIEGWQSPRLGVRFGIESGRLELFDPKGERLVTYVEAIAQRNLERERVERAEAIAGEEREEKERERERAQQAEAIAEEERERAERAERENQALQERLRALQQQLGQLGIDPDEIS